MKQYWEIVEFVLILLAFSWAGLIFIAGCSDSYMTIERRVIDAENNVPVYFYAEAEQAEVDTWRPVFTYYIYYLDVLYTNLCYKIFYILKNELHVHFCNFFFLP